MLSAVEVTDRRVCACLLVSIGVTSVSLARGQPCVCECLLSLSGRSVSQAGSPSYRGTPMLSVPNAVLGWRRLSPAHDLP